MSTELVILSNHLILWHPPLLLPSISPSIRVFFSKTALHIRWPKYWSFSFSISLLSDLIFFKYLVPHILQTFADKSYKKELFHPATPDILDLIFLGQWQCMCVCGGRWCLFTEACFSSSPGKESACSVEDLGSIAGLGRSLEKEMALHSSIPAWRTPWTEEPGRLQSVGSKGVGHDRVTDRLPLLGRCPKHLPGCDKPKWVQILLFVPYGSKPLPG